MCARGDTQTLIGPDLSAALPLLPARLHLIIILAGLHLIIILATARARIASLGVPTALEKRIARLGIEPGAVVTPGAAARNGDIDRRSARDKAALGLVVQHRDELGAIIGLAAQRLVRDDDRGSR